MSPKHIALLVSTAASFLVPYLASSINIALPSIGNEFSMNAIALAWVATAFLLTAAISLVPLGRLSDIYGRKKVFNYGLALFTISSLLCAAASSDIFLIVSRGFQGIAGAMLFGTATAILVSVYPVEERGRVIGINAAAVSSGSPWALSSGAFSPRTSDGGAFFSPSLP